MKGQVKFLDRIFIKFMCVTEVLLFPYRNRSAWGNVRRTKIVRVRRRNACVMEPAAWVVSNQVGTALASPKFCSLYTLSPVTAMLFLCITFEWLFISKQKFYSYEFLYTCSRGLTASFDLQWFTCRCVYGKVFTLCFLIIFFFFFFFFFLDPKWTFASSIFFFHLFLFLDVSL
jgi:hypothetical protein